jgi:hypothetical protein
MLTLGFLYGLQNNQMIDITIFGDWKYINKIIKKTFVACQL